MRSPKKLSVVIGIAIIILVGGWWVYSYWVPEMISEALVEGTTIPVIFPKEVKNKVNKHKKTLGKIAEEALQDIDSSQVSFNDLLLAIDEVKKKEIEKALQEINTKKPSTTNEIFNIAQKNITVTAFDPEIFRKTFNTYATTDKINRVINYIDNNNVMDDLDVNISRAVLKKILIQKKAEIDKKLKETGGPELK